MVTKCKVAAKIGNGQRKRQKEDPTRDNFVASRKKHQRIGITACRSRVQVSIQTEGELLTTVSDELSASGPFSAVASASAPATRVNNVPKSKNARAPKKAPGLRNSAKGSPAVSTTFFMFRAYTLPISPDSELITPLGMWGSGVTLSSVAK